MGWPNNFVQGVYDETGKVIGIGDGAGGTIPILEANRYIKTLLPLSQSGGASVLPIDYSLNNVSCSFGAGTVAPWANAGYFTSDAGTQSYLSVPNSAFNPNLFTDSFIIGFTLNKNTEAGASTNTLLGNSDGSAASTGIFVLYGQTSNANANKLGVRIMGGSTSLGAGNTSLTSATYASSATLVDANDHRVLITWDAITKVVKLYVDGVALYTSSALAVTSTDEMAGNFRFGQGLTGVSVSAKFAGIQLIEFPSSGLPLNITELIAHDNLHKRTGLVDQHFFL